jgi:hypothetical protein
MTLYKTNCKLIFKQDIYNGTMNMLIYADNQLIASYMEHTQERFELDIDIVLPCRLRFVLTGKNMDTDTQIDEQGRITADKCVVLERFYLNKVEIPTHKLQASCTYTTDHGIIHEIYWGFNGEVVIDFPYQNAVEWHLRSLMV